MNKISLKINDTSVEVSAGATVLQAAKEAGIRIPTLCAHDALEPHGSCRLCVVQIEGMRGFPTACTTPAAEGMQVTTETPEIFELRREVLKLMLSGHTSPCLVCLHKELCEKYRPAPTRSGRITRCSTCGNRDSCELRDLAEEFKVEDLDLPIIYKDVPVEQNDPFMDRDYSLCVLCGRCSRICKKLHGKSAIDFVNRGKEARIGTAFHHDHLDSDCLFCGSCIDICPTGALADRFAKWRGQPDTTVKSACILCPIGCELNLNSKDGHLITSTALAHTEEARICAAGRFVLAQILELPARLKKHQVRADENLRQEPYEKAVAAAAEKLAAFTDGSFGLIAQPAAPREEIYVLKKFTTEVMKSDTFVLAGDTIGGKVKAVLATGDYIDAAARKKLDLVIAIDIMLTGTAKAADIVFAAGVFAESDGSYLSASGDIRELQAAAAAPDGIVPDWQVICDIAQAMGAKGFDFETVADIRKELEAGKTDETAPAAPEPSPLDELKALPSAYRGHQLTDMLSALKAVLGIKPDTAAPEQPAVAEGEERPFKILAKSEIVPNTHMVTIHAPRVAAKVKPGNFVIAMVHHDSERIPYTVADNDPEAGTITVNVLEAGRSSREMALVSEGDYLAHFVGPLGKEVDIKNYGTVVCAGGCYGVGAVLPLSRALRAAGNKVITIEEASSGYLLYWEDKLAANADEFLVVTKDGSKGMKGGIQEVIAMLHERGEKIDQSFLIGCTFMMMMVSLQNKEFGIPTQTAMNSIMLDGTGMCGACRVSVGGETKFACVDGPFIDGLAVDWEELMQRNSAYKTEEVKSLPQDHKAYHCMDNVK